MKKIGFIGAGRMATALAQGLIKASFTTADSIQAYDIYESARQSFQENTGGKSSDSLESTISESDILVLSVKPQQMVEVLNEITTLITENHLVISIAAGVPIKTYLSNLGNSCRLIRVMPNTPALVGEGASAFSLGGRATPEDSQLVLELLSTVGYATEVPEKLLDAVTGLSGSGPAYVYQIIEALSDGGVQVGLPRDIATKLAAQTLLGAAKMVLETNEHPGVLKDAVTSPGGTTITGLQTLESHGLRSALMMAVKNATSKSIELGKSS
jgi:pyrroline-5-carboxylate reductase